MMVNVKTGVAALVIGLFLTTSQQPAPFETVYDVQKDLTTVRLPFYRISGEKDRYYSLDFSVYYTYSGQTKRVPESINVELISVVKARKLNSDLYVVFVADGESLHFGSNRSAIPNPVKGRTWVGERMVFNVPVAKFEKLAAAKELAVKMGPTLFPLSDDARESLRVFAKEVGVAM
jgi:hypothetical protein